MVERRVARTPRSAAAPSPSRLPRWVIIAALIAGIAARVITIGASAGVSYLPDHKDALAWGTYALRFGPASVYDMPGNPPVFVRYPGLAAPQLERAPHVFNYPPFSAYLFALQAWIWHAVEPQQVIVPQSATLSDSARAFGLTPGSRWPVAWTVHAQFASALPTLPWDLLLAFGVMALVRAFSPAQRRDLHGALAFAVTWLAPPIILNSSYWNQYEAWTMAPAVWALYFFLRERFVRSGACMCAALLLKTSAILVLPVLAFAAATSLLQRQNLPKVPLHLLRFFAGAGAVVLVGALPVVLHDYAAGRGDAPIRWLKHSYFETIGGTLYERTTMNAFNIWWLDYLSGGLPFDPTEHMRTLDSKALFLGMTKDALGKLLLGVAIIAAYGSCWRRYGLTPLATLACAALILLAVFVLPTRVHERYCYFCIPFLIALAFLESGWRVPAILLLLVGTFEMTSFRWVAWGKPTSQTTFGLTTALLSLTSVVAMIWCYALVVRTVPRPAAQGRSSTIRKRAD